MQGNNEKLALKLLIDKSSNKVLFGEGGKDVVDFIFSLLSLPLGVVTKLLTEDSMVGSIGKVYQSLGKLNGTYILSNEKISSLLNPQLASTSNPNTNFLLPPATNEDSTGRRFYMCSSTSARCYTAKNKEAQFVNPPKSVGSVVEGGSEGKGYVKGVVTYSVMDDLTVVPMSTISSIAFLNKFHIKDLGSLEEKMVGVGFDEVTYILIALYLPVCLCKTSWN
ncbi:hypothetical protein LUZ62_022493 [Rhynchospora pubera]|uniref:Uncharacterized protein n=1 Tax=Rhynchospora pubera TaxID=906938 RepID=A0AAV8H580_9POAL|nr:hypothetical protein LUZ62_022493 [Rhynchospora pubera]